jgi:predicted GH43/DUF377 family glycosyl hydrolase
MNLIIIPILFSLSFSAIFLFFAIRRKRSRIFWPIIGACIGLAVLFPFRTYRVAPLDPSLEASLTNDSIINTTDISIPGYPNAYNPSLIPYEEGYLLSFRVKYYDFASYIRKLCNVRTDYLGLVKLNRQLKICGEPYLLDLQSYDDTLSHSAQDARLFKLGQKVLLFFNDYGATRHRSSYALYVTELIEKEGQLQPKQRAKQLKYENMISIEKNWIPFVAAGKLFLIYSGQPHLILEPNLESGTCQRVASTDITTPWKWGEIRGGAPAAAVDEGLLTFFHSSQELPALSFFGQKTGRNYAMGAYIFENTYPFTIRKITPTPLGQVEDYVKNNRRKVVFPSGMVIDEEVIHVAWGKNDTNICISTFDKEKLISGMIPCAN